MQPNESMSLLQRNIIVSMLIQVLSLAINLVSKRAICLYLNVEYLGLQSLYTNFCDVLSFAYFGAGTAMLFSFYGPLARGDTRKLASLYRYYDGIYRRITVAAFCAGLGITGFAVFFINAEIKELEVIITFLTFMLSVVLYNRHLPRNYFIQADQRRYFVAAVTGGVDCAALGIQVLVLWFFRSYEAFVLCILIKNLAINAIFGRHLKSRYAYLFTESESLEQTERDTIRSNVSDMVLYRFGAVLISSTAIIFISKFINTAMAGIYSNYQFIVLGITSLVNVFYESVTARVGQTLSLGKEQDGYRGFQLYSFLNSWMVGATVVCFYYLVQDFVGIWMGSLEQLAPEIILVIIVNYYLETCRFATKMYRESAGLFKNIKRMILIKGSLNIILSYMMGMIWGLWGILAATTIASVATLFWYEPFIVYRYFKKSLLNEVYYQGFTLLLLAISFCMTGFMMQYMLSGGLFHFLLKAAVCGVTANVSYVLFYFIIRRKMKEKNE